MLKTMKSFNLRKFVALQNVWFITENDWLVNYYILELFYSCSWRFVEWTLFTVLIIFTSCSMTKCNFLSFQMKHLLFLLLLKSILTEACSSVRYDEDPVPYLTSVLAKCDLKPRVDYECSTASEQITCHSCVLENIRVKCPALPEYVEDVEQKVFVLQRKSKLKLLG